MLEEGEAKKTTTKMRKTNKKKKQGMKKQKQIIGLTTKNLINKLRLGLKEKINPKLKEIVIVDEDEETVQVLKSIKKATKQRKTQHVEKRERNPKGWKKHTKRYLKDDKKPKQIRHPFSSYISYGRMINLPHLQINI